MNDRSNNSASANVKRILKIFIRLLSIPLVMGIGILSGMAIVYLIDGHVPDNLKKTFYTASMAFGAAIILSIIKDVTENMPNFYFYVFAKDKEKSTEAFLKAFGAIFLASFALMISILSGTEYSASKKAGALQMDLAFYQSNTLPSPIDSQKSLLTMYILYLCEAGQKSLKNDRGDCATWPDELYEEQLTSLMNALISCGGSEKNPVKIQVRGFASAGLSEHFKDVKLNDVYKRVDGSDDIERHGKAFNLYVAEQRAENLVTKIQEIAEVDRNIDISVYKWENYREMETELNLNDRRKGKYVKSRGFLTRRAEIRVLAAPACEKNV
jgi:hypothetical protein